MFIVPMSQLPTISALNQAKTPIGMVQNDVNVPFADIFKEAINNVKETQAQSESDAYNLALGKSDDLHTVMINSEKAATAIELTVQLTSKAVSAYKEIMQMQV